MASDTLGLVDEFTCLWCKKGRIEIPTESIEFREVGDAGIKTYVASGCCDNCGKQVDYVVPNREGKFTIETGDES